MARPDRMRDLARWLDQPLGDPAAATLWEGKRLSLTGAASGGRLPSQRYRLTAQHLSWTTSRIPGRSQSVPTWAIRDARVEQSLSQRARRLGDVTVAFQHPRYTGEATYCLLENIENPKRVARLIEQAAAQARRLQGN